MKKAAVWAVCAALALATLFVCMDSAAQLRHAAPVFAREDRVTVVIDAGHGGEDGGASSRSGVLESTINLEIAKRIEDLLHFAGVRTQMIRTQDISVCTEGGSIQQKKVSDLKNRVQMVERTPNALLLSIHQNYSRRQNITARRCSTRRRREARRWQRCCSRRCAHAWTRRTTGAKSLRKRSI